MSANRTMWDAPAPDEQPRDGVVEAAVRRYADGMARDGWIMDHDEKIQLVSWRGETNGA